MVSGMNCKRESTYWIKQNKNTNTFNTHWIFSQDDNGTGKVEYTEPIKHKTSKTKKLRVYNDEEDIELFNMWEAICKKCHRREDQPFLFKKSFATIDDSKFLYRSFNKVNFFVKQEINGNFIVPVHGNSRNYGILQFFQKAGVKLSANDCRKLAVTTCPKDQQSARPWRTSCVIPLRWRTKSTWWRISVRRGRRCEKYAMCK